MKQDAPRAQCTGRGNAYENACEMRVMQSCDLLKANSVIDGVGLEEVDSYIFLG